MKKYTVACDGSGDFLSIQDALKLTEDEITLYVKNGKYLGQIFSTKKKIHIIGEDENKTIISCGIGGKHPHSDGNLTGTFRSYTAYFSGDYVELENLTIENTAGQGSIAGQAIALYASSSIFYCKKVRLLGYQDTLFTAPLPEKERLVGGFRGPEMNLPRKPSTQLYEDCYISGTIDFIFGSADALFENCKIAIHDTTSGCYITAPSTLKNGIGYIFNNCKIIQVEPFSVKDNKKIYLGRPWREYAKCCWMNSDFSDIICEESWDNWNNPENEKTIQFLVHKNTWNHPNNAGECSFAKEMSEKQVLENEKLAKDIRYKVTSLCSIEA